MIYTITVICFIASTLVVDDSIMIKIPFVHNDWPHHRTFTLVTQIILDLTAALISIHCHHCIVFIAFEIMAALDVLYYFINSNRENIQKHPEFFKILIIRYCDVISNINLYKNALNMVLFYQFIISSLLNLTVFSYMRLNPSSPMGYFICLCTIFQIFIPCLFGEIIKLKSERLSNALYMTNWYDLDTKNQRAFLLILGMAQRQYGLKAAGMYDVNIYRFIQIMKISITYCTLLITFTK